jgi:DNA-binding response OmpR family regulator
MRDVDGRDKSGHDDFMALRRRSVPPPGKAAKPPAVGPNPGGMVSMGVGADRRFWWRSEPWGGIQCDIQGVFSQIFAYSGIATTAGGMPMAEPPHIVVVEDEATQRQLLVEYLGRQNFRVSGVDGGSALRRMCERELPALVLLDVGLPGEDGFALARWLRERSGRVGIIMVTAATDTVDRVVGLETGADDYIPKPVEMRELLARVKSVLRRTTGAAVVTSVPRVRMGRLVLDLDKRVLVDPAGGGEQPLTASEFDLLKLFAENPNRPLQRDWLLESAAHREMEAFDRAIDLRITRLRRKIEHDPAHPDAIRTVRGVGYMFVPPKD